MGEDFTGMRHLPFCLGEVGSGGSETTTCLRQSLLCACPCSWNFHPQNACLGVTFFFLFSSMSAHTLTLSVLCYSMFSISKESLTGSGSCVCVSVRCRKVRWRGEHKHSCLLGGNPDLGGHGAAENAPVCNDTFPSVPTVHDTQLVQLSRVPPTFTLAMVQAWTCSVNYPIFCIIWEKITSDSLISTAFF